jgi:transcriptional regulator with GAF, ATPase, and Fis domain
MGSGDPEAALRLRRERDFYRRLLEIGATNEPEPFLEQALDLIVDVSGARQAYIELRGEDEDAAPTWSMARGCSSEEVDDIRAAISRGIIAEALASGKTVFTPSALLDPRFRDRGSVRLHHVEAVLCAPMGGSPALGVVYLQGRAGGVPFTDEDRELAELFALHLAPLADRLLVRRRIREQEDLTRPIRQQLRLDDVIGRSAPLAAVLRQAALVAPLEVNVLLTGASGTGKSQLARVIHDNGPRALGPFVDLNCAALPESLIESELFGAVAGAHSTASKAMAGKVAAAERGTLFLDEIAELSTSAQAKLLQLLQSKQYFRLGGTEPIRANIRLIAATNADLEQAVRERRFREDLFYRLQVLPIRLPSLAERRDDLGLLALHFIEAAQRRHTLRRLDLSQGALRAIEAAEWPGNLRQLAHAIEAAAIRAAGERTTQVERRHLFPQSADTTSADQHRLTFQEATRQFQRELLQETLAETAWNIAETARRLDLARSHVYNLVKAFGLDRQNQERL